MTQEHTDMRDECDVRFKQQDQSTIQIVRSLEKLTERVGTLLTDTAVMKESVTNHQSALQAEQKAQELRHASELAQSEVRVQQSISRLWKVVLMIVGSVGAGGGGAAINQWVF